MHWLPDFFSLSLGLILGLLAAFLALHATRRTASKVNAASQTGSPSFPSHVHRSDQSRHTTETPSALGKILDHLFDGAVLLDRDRRIILANASAHALLDMPPAPQTRPRFLDVVRNAQIQELLDRATSSRQPATVELDWVKRGKRRLRIQAIPLPEAGESVLVLVRDQTEIHRLEQVRQEFVANVSHELKTPLSAIVAITDTLLELTEIDRNTAEEFLRDLKRQADRLYRLILDLLRLSQLESASPQLERVSVDLSLLADEVCKQLTPLARSKGLLLSLDAVPVSAMGDPTGIREVLENLVDNAIKYTPAGGKVHVCVRSRGDQAVLEVSDTGIGISRQHQQRIFERFYRVDRNRSRAEGGHRSRPRYREAPRPADGGMDRT